MEMQMFRVCVFPEFSKQQITRGQPLAWGVVPVKHPLCFRLVSITSPSGWLCTCVGPARSWVSAAACPGRGGGSEAVVFAHSWALWGPTGAPGQEVPPADTGQPPPGHKAPHPYDSDLGGAGQGSGPGTTWAHPPFPHTHHPRRARDLGAQGRGEAPTPTLGTENGVDAEAGFRSHLESLIDGSGCVPTAFGENCSMENLLLNPGLRRLVLSEFQK